MDIVLKMLMKWKVGELCLLIFLCCSFSSPHMPDDNEEYAIKAAFIYKFTNYIDWDTLVPGNEFTIGIMGSSPIKDELEKIASTKTINNKKIVIKKFDKPEDISNCNILFIPQRCKVPQQDILVKVPGKGILTIGEKPGFATQGGGLNFIVVDDKLKFEANPKAINAAGLKASSQLLKLAIIVG